MDRKEILSIIWEEGKKKHTSTAMIVAVQIRIATIIAERLFRGFISEERYDLLIAAIKSGPPLMEALAWAGFAEDEDEVVIEADMLFNVYSAIESGFSFLLDNYEYASLPFRGLWSRDTLVRELAAVSIDFEMRMEALKGNDDVLLPRERVRELLKDLGSVEVGVADSTIYTRYSYDLSTALLTADEYLENL